MNLITIIKGIGLDPKRVKLICHSGDKFEQVKDSPEALRYYSCLQRKGGKWNIDDCDVLLVFGAGEGVTGMRLFYCAYQKTGKEPVLFNNAMTLPENFPTSKEDTIRRGDYLFQFEKYENPILASLEKRLWVSFKGRDGVRNLVEDRYEVLSIQNRRDYFPGYDNVNIMYDDLAEVLNNINAYPAWKSALENVFAVYLLVDTQSGQQYIGSATGDDGLLDRWLHYVRHGVDNHLTKIIDPKNFRFSILEILNKRAQNQALERENFWKEKLGSRAFGLNDN